MSSVISTVKEPKQMNEYEDDTVKSFISTLGLHS